MEPFSRACRWRWIIMPMRLRDLWKCCLRCRTRLSRSQDEAPQPDDFHNAHASDKSDQSKIQDSPTMCIYRGSHAEEGNAAPSKASNEDFLSLKGSMFQEQSVWNVGSYRKQIHQNYRDLLQPLECLSLCSEGIRRRWKCALRCLYLYTVSHRGHCRTVFRTPQTRPDCCALSGVQVFRSMFLRMEG